MTSRQLTVVSFAVCPVGTLRSYDGDGCRANLLSDGRIYSGLNGYSFPIPDNCSSIFQQPQGIRDLVASLINTTLTADPNLRLTHVSNQLDGRDACEVGAGLAANGCDVSVLDNTRIVLHGASMLETCVITYNNGDVEDALSDGLSGRAAREFIADAVSSEPRDEDDIIARATQSHAPAVLLNAIPKLVEAGFRVTGTSFDTGSIRTIILYRGDTMRGIRVELQWYL